MNKLFIAVIGASVLLGISPLLLDEFTVNANENNFYSNLTVIDTDGNETNKTLGISADRNLQFGMMIEDVNVTKTINLTSNNTVLATLESEGNISKVLDYNNSYYFEGDQQIPVTARAGEPGYFEGSVNLKTRVPDNRLGEVWLDLKSSFY